MMGGSNYDYHGAAVIVSGGTRGIGYAIAKSFLDSGAEVTVTGRSVDANSYRQDLSQFRYERLDLEDAECIDGLVERIDRIDILINNAGTNLPDGGDEWEPDVFRTLRSDQSHCCV